MKNNLIIACVAGISFLTACKKTDVPNNSTTDPVTTTTNKLKDSVALYTRDIYLWYSQIPSSFNAQSYDDPDKIMTAIRAYSMETGFTQPVDRWSFAYKQTDWDNLSSGISQDFGLGVFFNAEGDLRIKSVEKGSPAGTAGIRRGWRITKIAGNTDITTSNADFIVQNVFSSTSTAFTFQKPDGSSTSLTLSAATYQEHPVMLDSVYSETAGKVGYIVFNSFLGDTAEIYNEFQRVFNRFSQQQVRDVVVDLRYNGGGYVNVQQQFANWLVSTAANGNIMMKEQFNDKYAELNETTNFQKKGTLNLSRIFFIVSDNTASASELLINNLKPYMDVKLVGPDNTYGKPVGFFPIPVGDWYIFPVSFRSTNKNGEGNYFNGITTNNLVADGLDKDWGDRTESCLASVLKYINSGSFRVKPGQEYATNPELVNSNKKLSASLFKGTVGVKKVFVNR